MEEDTFTFAGRLATFEQSHHLAKRRASSTRKKAPSTASWPHKTPTPEELAHAGFYYRPTTTSPDNVRCFLCQTQLDGWEPGDNPTHEHLTHSPECGWAINQCIRSRNGDPDRNEDDPLCDKMIEARRATFMDRWPHEGKKGWRCKVQKMIEAGWIYDPAPDADDGATCCYCGLSLDGWEPRDNPSEEHRRRAADCYFFILSDRFSQSRKPARKKGRGSRASKASRLSTQSNLTAFSEAPSLMSLGDDALPGAEDSILSTATAVTVMTTTSTDGKTRKAKSKATGKGTKKSTRGRKNAAANEESAVDASIISSSKAVLDQDALPAPKARSTRQNTQQDDAFHVDSSSALDNGPPKKTTRGRQAKAKSKPTPDEDGSQLQSELLEAVQKAEEKESAAPKRGTKRSSDGLLKNGSSITIAPPPAKEKPKGRGKKAVKQNEIDSQPQLSEESQAQDSVAEAKATRKPRKGLKTRGQHEKDSSHMSSQFQTSASLSLAPTREHELIDLPTQNSEEMRNRTQGMVGRGSTPAPPQHTTPPRAQDDPRPVKESTPSPSPQSSDAENKPPSSRPPSMRPPLSVPRATRVPLGDATPMTSPSKRPNNLLGGGLQSALPWDPVDLEFVFLPSPTTRQMQDRLFDANTSFHPFDKENFPANLPLQDVVRRVKEGLTSPEKKMSVEEWIYFNAKRGEDKLRSECERMVGLFEAEGGRAIRVLEGIECDL